MASIEDKGNGNWCVRWREGRAARQQTVNTRRDAERIRREVERAISEGRRWAPAEALRAPLLGDSAEGPGAVSAYLAALARRGLKSQSITNVHYILKEWGAWLAARLRRAPDLGDLSLVMLEAWHDHKAAVVQPRTAATAVRHVERLWAWLADRDEYAALVARPRRADVALSEPVLRPYALRWADLDAAIEEARRSTRMSWQWKALLIQRFTGLRIWQACRLTWDDVDLERALVAVRPELGKTRQERRGRIVPISPHLVAELAGWGLRTGRLTGRDSDDPPRTGTMKALWDRVGLDVRQPTHAFRRTFIHELVTGGVLPHVVGYLVGHDLGLAVGTYADRDAALRETARAAVALVPALGTAGGNVRALCAPGPGRAATS